MTPEEYQNKAIAFASQEVHVEKFDLQLLHAAMGISTEAGELLDALKKQLYYGKDLDTVNILEELGDVLWYIALACYATGASFESLMERNIAKLSTRYGAKFSQSMALDRNLEAERRVLAGEIA